MATINLTNDRARQLADALVYAVITKAANGLVPFTWLSILNEINPAKAAEAYAIIDSLED